MGSRSDPEFGLVRPAEPGDGRTIAPRLREEDTVEIRDATALDAVDALELWIAAEDPVFVWEREGRLDAIGGVQDRSKGHGHAWLVSTHEGLSPPHGFHRLALECLMAVEGHYDVLTASSGRPLEVHHRWLRRLGFKEYDSDEHFHYFYRRR